MSFTPIPDHVQKALTRLLAEYQNSTNLRNLLTALINPIQDIEDELGLMNTEKYLPDAVGAQLDILGSIVGIARAPGTSDAIYAQQILGQIKINTSQGQPEQTIQTFELFTGSTFVILTEFLASVIMASTWIPSNQQETDSIIRILLEVLPAGVRPDGIISFDPTDAFSYDGLLPGVGYDDGSQTVGGKYPTLHQFIGDGFEYAGDNPTGLGYGSIHDPLVGGAYIT